MCHAEASSPDEPIYGWELGHKQYLELSRKTILFTFAKFCYNKLAKFPQIIKTKYCRNSLN